MADKRKPVSKSLRFRVFHRDEFACQYCGRTPPAVVLVVDHFIPVAKGGGNEEDNLVTCCVDCNQGKGARDMSTVPQSLADRAEERRELAEQTDAYNLFLLEQRTKADGALLRLGVYWCDLTARPRARGQYTVCDGRRRTLRTFLGRLAEAEIMEAMDLAHSRLEPSNDSCPNTWKYFCGICWKKIKGGRS